MKHGQDTVDRVRSIMAPGNPVPGDVLPDRQRDPHRQRTHDRILAGAWADPPAPPRFDACRGARAAVPDSGRGARGGSVVPSTRPRTSA